MIAYRENKRPAFRAAGIEIGGRALHCLADGDALLARVRRVGRRELGGRGSPREARGAWTPAAVEPSAPHRGRDRRCSMRHRPFDVHSHTGVDVDGTDAKLRGACGRAGGDRRPLGHLPALRERPVMGREPARGRGVPGHPERLVPFARLDPRVSDASRGQRRSRGRRPGLQAAPARRGFQARPPRR